MKRHRGVNAMTARVLRAAVARIEQQPHRFDMDVWLAKDRDTRNADWEWESDDIMDVADLKEECGTVGCLAAWIVSLKEEPEGEEDNPGAEEDYEMFTIAGYAADLAELTPEQKEALFFMDTWPEVFEKEYYQASQRSRVGVLRRRIEYFIKEGK